MAYFNLVSDYWLCLLPRLTTVPLPPLSQVSLEEEKASWSSVFGSLFTSFLCSDGTHRALGILDTALSLRTAKRTPALASRSSQSPRRNSENKSPKSIVRAMINVINIFFFFWESKRRNDQPLLEEIRKTFPLGLMFYLGFEKWLRPVGWGGRRWIYEGDLMQRCD